MGRLIVIALLLVAICEAIRVAWADWLFRQETVESTERALRLDSGNAAYWFRLAQLKAVYDRAGARRDLETALRLNPRNAKAWIEIGLSDEIDGDLAGAERRLLEAARVNRQYEPRWTLANFYFRRGRHVEFWKWARDAVPMLYGDPVPLFRLCWRVSDDGAFIERQLDMHRKDTLTGYLWFLISEGHVDGLESAAARVDDVRAVRAACDLLLAHKQVDAGMRVWNLLCESKRLPYRPLDPSRGVSITNGDFAERPAPDGFDWRYGRMEGISFGEQARALRIDFSGRQPEACDVLTQLAPVLGSRDYELRVREKSERIGAGSGLEWKVLDAATGEALGGTRFRTPAGMRLVKIVLAYRRALGTTRIDGRLWLNNVELVLLNSRS
jgi:hypothetical protein